MVKFKKSYLILLLIVSSLFFIFPFTFATQLSSGDNLIDISSVDDLFEMVDQYPHMGEKQQNYRLTADIDFGGKEWFGTGETPFRGHFDGNGYTIKNVKLTANSFGTYESIIAFWTKTENAFIHDVKFENLTAEDNFCHEDYPDGGKVVYGLVGKASGGTLQNIEINSSKIDITAGKIVAGGLVGEDLADGLRTNISTFNNTYNLTSITKEVVFGGLCGEANAMQNAYKICKADDHLTLNSSSSRTSIAGGMFGNVNGEMLKLRDLSCQSTLILNATSILAGGIIGNIYIDTALDITSRLVFDGKIVKNA